MSKNKIAQHLNRSHSTIIKEIKHNTGKRGYRYNQDFIDANLYATIIAFVLKVGESIERERIFLMK
jgi:IS30 family transposase